MFLPCVAPRRHPFGATGARLVTTVANRLQREDGRALQQEDVGSEHGATLDEAEGLVGHGVAR